MKNERYIPHTNPEWNLRVPDGMLNSLVPEGSERPHNDPFNYDEWDDPEDETGEEEPKAPTWDDLKNEEMGGDKESAA